MYRLVPLLGILTILGIAVLLSKNRSAIRWRIVGWGLGLQFLVALFVMRTNVGYWLLDNISTAVKAFLNFSFAGSRFVFGPLGDPNGQYGIIFAFQVLPIIIYVASFFSLLYYLGVLPFLVKIAANIMFKLMRTSGAESLEVAASILMGQTEAPLVIRPYLADLTESELMTIMTAGMAHIAGSVMGAYILFGAEARHLLTAVVMTAPGTILISKILVPETGQPKTAGEVKLVLEKKDVNALDAFSKGVTDGLFLSLNVAAMLIAFIAVIYLANGILGYAHGVWAGYFGPSHPTLSALVPSSLETFFGWILSPIAWLLGVPWADAQKVGNLMGIKVVINEFVAFTRLGALKDQISYRSFTIATYALCGFANFSSIGIQIGGIGSLAPTRKHDLARLGFRALLAGTLANYLAAAMAGLLL